MNAATTRALAALDGLSVGDSIGEALSYQCYRAREIADFSVFRDHTVRYTDDTEMACALVSVLSRSNYVDQDELAREFATRFSLDPDRGYGRMAKRILRDIDSGMAWQTASHSAFGGAGSFGNGGAMRIAPLGAFFAEHSFEEIAIQAVKSAEITHHHPEGIAGAVAVAIGAASAAKSSIARKSPIEASAQFWEDLLDFLPESEVRLRIEKVSSLSEATPSQIAKLVGNGAEITAQDTVPFCLWNAARCLDNYREAIISAIEVDGDCDTNCAIIGGIVTSYSGSSAIPSNWLRVREKLPKLS